MRGKDEETNCEAIRLEHLKADISTHVSLDRAEQNYRSRKNHRTNGTVLSVNI